LLDEATSGLRRDLNCRKLEAEDTNRSRLDEEMLGHRLYISATGLAGHRAYPRRKCCGNS